MPEPGGGWAPQAAWGWVRGAVCGACEDAADSAVCSGAALHGGRGQACWTPCRVTYPG